jgi:hypothetical protein
MKMKIEPIEILLEDNKAFAQVAFLLDNPLFTKDIKKLRDKYKIIKPLDFSSYALISHFVELEKGKADLLEKSDFKLNLNGLQYVFEEPERLLEYLIEYQSEKQLGQDLYKKVIAIEQQFVKDVIDIRGKYLYPPMFNSCIFQAVLFNKVKVFRTAFATVINTPAYSFESNQDIEEKREKIMAIIATPYSTEKDILDAFKQGLIDVRNVIESTHPLNQVLEKDTLSNIKRDRNLHWRITNGEKYKNLVDEFNLAQNSIERAVLRYRKNLQFSPKS